MYISNCYFCARRGRIDKILMLMRDDQRKVVCFDIAYARVGHPALVWGSTGTGQNVRNGLFPERITLIFDNPITASRSMIAPADEDHSISSIARTRLSSISYSANSFKCVACLGTHSQWVSVVHLKLSDAESIYTTTFPTHNWSWVMISSTRMVFLISVLGSSYFPCASMTMLHQQIVWH